MKKSLLHFEVDSFLLLFYLFSILTFLAVVIHDLSLMECNATLHFTMLVNLLSDRQRKVFQLDMDGILVVRERIHK